MKRLFYLILFFAAFSFSAAAQQVQQSGWLASFNTFGINQKWSVHFDAQVRSSDDVKHLQTLLLRPGINYHFNKSVVASAGYAFIPARRTVAHMSELFTEHRLWQQLVYNHKVSSVATAHRVRFEQRFLPHIDFTSSDLFKNGTNTAYRLRYFIRNVLPLKGAPAFTEGPFFALQNEVFLNTGNKGVVNGRTFDQNRLYLAFGYRLPNSKIDLEMGYLNQYSRLKTGHTNNHVAQLAIYKRL